MATSIVVRLRTRLYDAAQTNPFEAEWPPAPARVFNALVAAVHTAAEWRVLERLEQAAAPHVWADPTDTVETYSSRGFVVTNATKLDGGHQTWPGRTAGLRQRAGTVPATPSFAVVYPDLDLDSETTDVLSRLARRVPYVGRSTSSAVVSVLPEVPATQGSWVVWRPHLVTGVRAGEVEVSVPYPGYSAGLRDAFNNGDTAASVRRLSIAYRIDGAEDTAPVLESTVTGPFTDLVVLGFAPGRTAVPGEMAAQVSEALRQATMRLVPNPVPAAISGKGADDTPHVAYVALPFVEHEHADGRLLGVGVAVPAGLDGNVRKCLLRAVTQRLSVLRFGPRQEVSLDYDGARVRPWGLVPARWTGGEHGAVSWVTATPVMLDRFPKGKATAEVRIAESVRRAGYPPPVEVEALPAPAVPGALYRPDFTFVKRDKLHRPMMHARIRFAAPVRGPVLAGALRYRGIGLFIPDIKD